MKRFLSGFKESTSSWELGPPQLFSRATSLEFAKNDVERWKKQGMKYLQVDYVTDGISPTDFAHAETRDEFIPIDSPRGVKALAKLYYDGPRERWSEALEKAREDVSRWISKGFTYVEIESTEGRPRPTRTAEETEFFGQRSVILPIKDPATVMAVARRNHDMERAKNRAMISAARKRYGL